MTAYETITSETIESVFAKLNGKRRKRVAELGHAIWLIRELLSTGAAKSVSHNVANAYGYASVGTYVAVGRKTTGEVVLAVWLDSTNRVGKLPGITARKPERVQEQIDAMQSASSDNGQIWVLDLENALELVSSTETEAALLRSLASNPGEPVALGVWKDYCEENGLEY